ncbi:hypothetical protein KAH43_01625 [Candidatus Bipolaricaulota bacterium]|nr:hypothetical protein [Candidatus Bipolaricaulota bacterium]
MRRPSIATFLVLIMAVLSLGRGATVYGGSWRVQTTVDPINDSQKISLRLDASSVTNAWWDVPTLVLRYTDQKPEVYIDWNQFIDTDSVRVTCRIDDESPTTSTWSVSTDYTGTFYDSWSVRGFIRSLATADQLVVRVTPYSESPVTAIFNLAGLQAELLELGLATTEVSEPAPTMLSDMILGLLYISLLAVGVFYMGKSLGW